MELFRSLVAGNGYGECRQTIGARECEFKKTYLLLWESDASDKILESRLGVQFLQVRVNLEKWHRNLLGVAPLQPSQSFVVFSQFCIGIGNALGVVEARFMRIIAPFDLVAQHSFPACTGVHVLDVRCDLGVAVVGDALAPIANCLIILTFEFITIRKVIKCFRILGIDLQSLSPLRDGRVVIALE